MNESELKQHQLKLQQDLQNVKDHLNSQGSTGVSLEIERRNVLAYLDGIGASLRALRENRAFWGGLAPSFRVQYEDFQGELAMLRAAYRE